MVKKLLPAVLLIMTFCFWSVSSAFAESVAVEGGKIFIADGDVTVLNLDGSDVDPTDTDCIDVRDALALVGDATDVVIADGKAFITVGAPGSVDVVIVDVSSCLSDDVPVEECFATIDLDAGILEIPCVYVDGVVYTVKMDQRGNSMNWEVSFADINGDLLDYRREGDDGGDGDGS